MLFSYITIVWKKTKVIYLKYDCWQEKSVDKLLYYIY